MPESDEIWQKYVKAYDQFQEASHQFHNQVNNKLHFVRLGLDSPARGAALSIAKNLPVEDLKAILRDIVELAVYTNAHTFIARDLVLKISKEWLLKHIEEVMEPILARNDYEEHTGVLHIYELIDSSLVLGLAKRDVLHEDEEIREVGAEFLRRSKQD